MHVNPTTTERPAAQSPAAVGRNKAAPAAGFGDLLKDAQAAAAGPGQGLTPAAPAAPAASSLGLLGVS